MDFLRRAAFLSLFFLSASCAKMSYLAQQGVGQLSLQFKGVSNHKLLADAETDSEIQEKIRSIIQYKAYFYEYWQKKPSAIYDKTTLLDREAVTYLVVASPHNQIKPRQECFWFMGCFPYLGFFSQKAAEKYAQKLNRKDWVTMVRPVYAYSTLGYFSDRILSSFFVFEEEDLVDLIFHELYHTIFFVRNEVDLNENLATYFAAQMTREYLQMTPERLQQQEAVELKNERLKMAMNEHVQALNQGYQELGEQASKAQTQEFFNDYLTHKFRPQMENLCQELELSDQQCFPLRREWNNASLAAFLTYEKRAQDLRLLHQRLDLELKDFQLYIEAKYQQYVKEKLDQSFESYLFTDA